MDFELTDAQRELGGLTRSILADRATPERLRELDAAGTALDRPLWTALAGAGVLSAALPKEAGGDGYGLLEQCSILVELGRAVAPVPYLATIVTAAAAIARFGDRDQCEPWAAPAARGELIPTAALGDSPVEATRGPDGWTL